MRGSLLCDQSCANFYTRSGRIESGGDSHVPIALRRNVGVTGVPVVSTSTYRAQSEPDSQIHSLPTNTKASNVSATSQSSEHAPLAANLTFDKFGGLHKSSSGMEFFGPAAVLTFLTELHARAKRLHSALNLDSSTEDVLRSLGVTSLLPYQDEKAVG